MSDRMDIRGAIGDGAARMSLPDLPQPEATQALLTGALRELEGIDTRLETWTADDHFTQFGKRRVIRYDLEARLAAAPNVRRYHWLGKFYDRDEDARRVASVLRELASFDGHAQSGLAFPSVLAYHAPRRLLLLTYESGESMTTAMAQDTEAILAAIGRALATLHSLPIAPTRILSPDAVLGSYARWSPADSRLESRVAWYERATLLRKIHGLLFSKSRDQHPEAVRQRQAEAVQLMRMG